MSYCDDVEDQTSALIEQTTLLTNETFVGYLSKSANENSLKFCQCCRQIKVNDDDQLNFNLTIADVHRNVQLGTVLTALELLLGIGFQFSFQYIIHNPTCNFLFKCGCTWEWAGGWKNCNIWSDGPKCPWCLARASVSWTTDYLIFALMCASYFYFFYHR